MSAEVWLLRHAEVASYEGDHALTERGVSQARAAGESLAAELDGDDVELRCAPSMRAEQTAEHVGAALRDRGVGVGRAVVDRGFENFRVALDGEVVAHDRMRPALRDADPAVAAWTHEVSRFAAIHDRGDDPITWWLTQPTLALEPAALVVRRLWRTLAALGAARTVVCTHSGPMRALAAYAVGRDPGEPEHLERIAISLDEPRATVSYRADTAHLLIPDSQEPKWD